MHVHNYVHTYMYISRIYTYTVNDVSPLYTYKNMHVRMCTCVTYTSVHGRSSVTMWGVRVLCMYKAMSG